MPCEQNFWTPCTDNGQPPHLCASMAHGRLYRDPVTSAHAERRHYGTTWQEHWFWAHERPELQRIPGATCYDLRCWPCCLHAMAGIYQQGDALCRQGRMFGGGNGLEFSAAVRRALDTHTEVQRARLLHDVDLTFHELAHRGMDSHDF